MRSYECTIALHPDLGDAGVQEQIDRIQSVITDNGGSVKQVAEWGPRDLSYPIRKERKGIFRVVVFDGEGATVSELERNMRISDHVLRYITIRIEADHEPLDLGPSRRASDDEEGSEETDLSGESAPAGADAAS